MNRPRPQIAGHWAGKVYEADPSSIQRGDCQIEVPEAMPYRKLYFGLAAVGKFAHNQRLLLRGYAKTALLWEFPYIVNSPWLPSIPGGDPTDAKFGLTPAFDLQIDAGVQHYCQTAATELALGQTHHAAAPCADALHYSRMLAPGSEDGNQWYRFTCYPFYMSCELTNISIESAETGMGTALQEDTSPGFIIVLGCWSQNTPL